MNIEELKGKIQKHLSELDDSSMLNVLKRNALRGLDAQLNEIKELKKITTYNLVFIGAIGTGKTTALSHLFDLIDDSNNLLEFPKPELLTTGSGGSTLCEVHIQLAEEGTPTYFELDFISKGELAAYVDDFADSVISEQNPEKKNVGAFLPQEIIRALRNILDLKKSRGKSDPAIELYDFCEKSDSKFSEFRAALQNRIINVKEGSEKVSSNNSLTEKQFIRTTFQELNAVTKKDYSIPKVIRLFLNKSSFGANPIWKQYHCLIDTKGLDKAGDREDIDAYFKKPKNIIFLTSTFADAPHPSVFYQLEKYATGLSEREVSKWSKRAVLGILPRNNEPAELLDADEDYDYGEELKSEHIQRQLSGFNGLIPKEYIVFYNAKNTKKEPSNKQNIFLLLEGIATQQQERDLGIEGKEDAIQRILDVEELEEDDKGKLVQFFKKIEETDIRSYKNFSNLFVPYFDNQCRHWATKHALNKRKGEYEYNNVYYFATQIINRNYINELRDTLQSFLKGFGTELSSSSIKELWKLIDTYQIDADFEVLSVNISRRLNEHLGKDEFSGKNRFWNELIEDEIRGEGYVERVLNKYREHLLSVDAVLIDIINDEWKDFINKTFRLLGKEQLENPIVLLPTYELREVRIQNYLGIKSIELSVIPEKQNCIILTGENGFGKTSILKGIVAGLIGPIDGNRVLAKVGIDEKTGIQVSYYDNKKKEVIPNDIRENVNPIDNLVAYGANRGNLFINEEEQKTRSYHLFNVDGAFMDIEQALIDWNGRPGDYISFYYKVRAILLEFLAPHVVDIRVNLEEQKPFIEYQEENKEVYIRRNALATGFKAVLGLVGDMIIRLSKNAPQNLKTLSGIVIIDEFDIHLHPKWQREVLIKLTSLFPRIQFILSTHSPIPLLGAPANTTIIKVDKDKENGITAEVLDIDFANLLPNAILTSPIFNFKELIPYAHSGAEFPETEDSYAKIVQRKKIEEEVDDYLTDERTQEILDLLKKEEEL